MAASALNAEVLKHLSVSSDIEFAWSENKGILRHTAIVLKFNGKPVLTIDYGQEGGYFGSSGFNFSRFNPFAGSKHQALGGSLQASSVVGAALLPGSDLQVNGFNISVVKAIKKIGKFLTNFPEGKQFIKDLMVEIANIKMGPYSVFNNNCRDFVEKAMDIIEAGLNRYQQKFRSFIYRRGSSDLKQHDKAMTMGVGIGLAIGAIGMGLLLSSSIEASTSDEEHLTETN